MFRILKSVALAVVRSDVVSEVGPPLLMASVCISVLLMSRCPADAASVVASGVRSGDRNGSVEYHVVAKGDLFVAPGGVCVFTVAGPDHVETVVLERCSVVRR